MDLTFLGNGGTAILSYLLLLLPLSMILDVQWGRGVRFSVRFKLNSLLAVRNLAVTVATITAMAIVVGAIQRLGDNRSAFEVSFIQELAQQAGHSSAKLAGGTINSAMAWVSNLSDYAKQLLAAKFAVDQLTWLAFELTVFFIARAAYAGKPFGSTVVKMLRWDAAAVLLLQTLSQYLDGVERSQISQELFAVNLGHPELPQAIGQSFNFPMWQIGAALLLLMVANIFARGTQLARDTEGLV